MNVNIRPTLYRGETESGILTPTLRQEISRNNDALGRIVTYFFSWSDDPEKPDSVVLWQHRDHDSEDFQTTGIHAGDLPQPEHDRFQVCRSIIKQQQKANHNRIATEGFSEAVIRERIEELQGLSNQIIYFT